MARRHRRSTISPSNSMLVPYAHRSLAVVPATSDLTVPRGWGVKEVLRPDGSRSDRVHCYYIFFFYFFHGLRNSASAALVILHFFRLLMQYYFEPGSGRKFRSIKEVNRYLKGEPSYSFGSKSRMIVPFKRVIKNIYSILF